MSNGSPLSSSQSNRAHPNKTFLLNKRKSPRIITYCAIYKSAIMKITLLTWVSNKSDVIFRNLCDYFPLQLNISWWCKVQKQDKTNFWMHMHKYLLTASIFVKSLLNIHYLVQQIKIPGLKCLRKIYPVEISKRIIESLSIQCYHWYK